MKLQKKVKRLLAKFDKVLAKLRSVSHLPEEEKAVYFVSAVDILQKLEEINCDFLYLESNAAILLQEISEQGIKCVETLTNVFDIVFRFLAHPEVLNLSFILCFDAFFLECSNMIKYEVSSNYRLVDYILSELLDAWEVHDSDRTRNMFETFGILLRYGITTEATIHCTIGATELTPHLLVDLLVLSLDLYYNHVTGNCEDNLYEEITDENRAIIIETFKDCVRFSLRVLQPISDTLFYFRCQECEVDQGEIMCAIEMLKPSIPQLEERVGNLKVTSLKHLCRCAVRKSLYNNWALPHATKNLELPDTLRDYLDLRTD